MTATEFRRRTLARNLVGVSTCNFDLYNLAA